MPLSVDQSLQKAKRLARKGDAQLAAELYQSVLQRFPNNKRAIAGLHALKGIGVETGGPPLEQFQTLAALFHQGRLKHALQIGLPLAKHYPMAVEVHKILGAIYAGLGVLEKSADSFAKALELDPQNADSHSNLGIAFNDLEKHEEAVACYHKAIELNPNSALTYNNLGNTLDNLGKQQEALENYRKAIEIDPNFTGAHNNMAVLLQQLGRLDEAIDRYNKALQIEPSSPELHLGLSSVKKYKEGDPQLGQMLRLIEEPGLTDLDLGRLSFAIGKAYGDLEDHEKSFANLNEGNRLRKIELKYDIAPDRIMYDELKRFSYGDASTSGNPAKTQENLAVRPVFIVGMLRSGSTLVEQILSSHSRVHGAGELDILTNIASKVDWKSEGFDGNKLQEIRETYLSGLAKIGAAEEYVTDKMPLNFQWLGLVLNAIPEAKVIHTKRDACATCWSIFKHRFSANGNGFAYSLSDVAEYYKMYVGLMAFWHEKYPGRIYDLNYERLTENQEEETRKLLEYVGLDWEDSCLDFHQTKRVVRTFSLAQVREKMYQGSSGEWRKYEQFLGPMIEDLKGL